MHAHWELFPYFCKGHREVELVVLSPAYVPWELLRYSGKGHREVELVVLFPAYVPWELLPLLRQTHRVAGQSIWDRILLPLQCVLFFSEWSGCAVCSFDIHLSSYPLGLSFWALTQRDLIRSSWAISPLGMSGLVLNLMPGSGHLASRKRFGAKGSLRFSREPVDGHPLPLTVCAVYKRRD